jgi:chromosome segregation ATPase
MLKSVKQTLERSREENIDAITVILNKREHDYRATVDNLEQERHQSLSYLEDLVCSQNTVLNKLRLHSRQLTSEIETILEQKNEIVQEVTVENQELRTKLSSAYERLEQTDTQLLQHNETHIKLKQRLIELNNKLKEYENIVSEHSYRLDGNTSFSSSRSRSIRSRHRI